MPESCPTNPVHRGEGVSKAFTYAGDIYLDEQDFFVKLRKNCLVWYYERQISPQEAWYLFREKGDMKLTFARAYGEFIKWADNELKKQKVKMPELPTHIQ